MEREGRGEMSSSERLLEENRLLGAIIEELRAQLRQTEDALLQTHAEAERWREEKEQRAREAREWQKEWQREKEKEAERGADERERFGESRISFTTRPGRGEAVVERVLLGELSSLEGEGGSLRSQADRWRVAAVEAGEAMREAQAECGLLHSQLQRLIAEDAPSSPACRAALKQQLRAELAGRRSEAGFGGAGGGATGRAGGESGRGGGVGVRYEEASREAYLGAVGRCHDLQRYVTQLASLDSKVRPQLIKAEERVASLLRENAGLHARLSGGAAAAHAALENAMVPNGGAEAFGASEEVSRFSPLISHAPEERRGCKLLYRGRPGSDSSQPALPVLRSELAPARATRLGRRLLCCDGVSRTWRVRHVHPSPSTPHL